MPVLMVGLLAPHHPPGRLPIRPLQIVQWHACPFVRVTAVVRSAGLSPGFPFTYQNALLIIINFIIKLRFSLVFQYPVFDEIGL
jgi:hypothetical protein